MILSFTKFFYEANIILMPNPKPKTHTHTKILKIICLFWAYQPHKNLNNQKKTTNPAEKWTKGFKWQFPKSAWQQQTKKGSMSLATRKTQIKTTVRYKFTPVRVAKIQRVTTLPNGGQSTYTPLVQSLWKTVWRFSEELETDLPFDPAIPLPALHSEGTNTLCQRDTCTTMFMAELFVTANIWI